MFEREVELKEYWPPVIGSAREFKNIALAQNPEFSLKWRMFQELLRELHVVDASGKGLGRWESLLEISVSPNYTVEDRRFIILMRLNEKVPYTERYVRKLLDQLFGAKFYVLEINREDQVFDLRARIIKSYLFTEVWALMRRIIPANMDLRIRKWLNKHFEFRQYAHAELSPYTHAELRVSVDFLKPLALTMQMNQQFVLRRMTHFELAKLRQGGKK